MNQHRTKNRAKNRTISKGIAWLQVFLVSTLLLVSCKQYLNPHMEPEANSDIIVAEMAAAGARMDGAPMAPRDTRIKLTLNNAPGADEPLEQELMQRQVEMFEKQNPDIRIEYSTWQFTPESFFERAKNRTLTDIVEVSAAQIPPILELNYAADITEQIAQAPFMQRMNPEVLRLFAKGERVFAVPLELHTVALFYNRTLVSAALNPAPKSTELPKPSAAGEKSKEQPKSEQKKKSKGADELPRDFSDIAPYLEDEPKPSIQLAQFFRRRQQPQQQPPQQQQYYYQQQDDRQQVDTRRGEQEVQDYFNVRPQQQQRRGRYQDPRYQDPRYQDPRYQDPRYRDPRGSMYDYQEESAQPRSRRQSDDEDSRQDDDDDSDSRESEKKETTDDDILTSEAEAALAQTTETVVQEPVTTVVETVGLPEDWESFIKLAVKMTDHERARYGYAPNLFAQPGGREYSQWAVQAGLEVEVPEAGSARLDIQSSAGGEVAKFIKDLRWQYDVMPSVDKCYTDNLMRMFASGQLGMMMLPATAETVSKLTKMGMHIDEIGIAPLPAGLQNRKHLTFGRALIINSQLERDKRVAAFKWLLFQLDPQVRAMRHQFYFREQDPTCGPEVPIYSADLNAEYIESLKWYRNLPYYKSYENVVSTHLKLEPPYFTERLYEAIAEGVRPIVEHQDSRPMESMRVVGVDFQNKYLENAPTPQGLQRYLGLLTGQ